MINSPVIIVGCPRSGTTLLYQVLAEVPELWSIGYESKAVIERYHHPSMKGWTSGALQAEDLTPESKTFMTEEFTRLSAPGSFWRRANTIRRWLAKQRLFRAIKRRGAGPGLSAATGNAVSQAGLDALRWAGSFYGRSALRNRRSIRLLEKTPENCLRLPFLQALFPDARFLYLFRDGRANVHSLMEGWRHPTLFPGYRVPEVIAIPGQSRGRWAFTLIPGWRELIDRPLAEVCAWQWVRCNEAVLTYRDQPGALPLLPVRFEDLLTRPKDTLEQVAAFIEVDHLSIPALQQGLPLVNVVSNPAVDKWQLMGDETLGLIDPIIRPMMGSLGY